MCGISGFTGSPKHSVLMRMTNLLTHRGPDDIGLLEHENVSLGMRRLAIIDVETGKQPISNEDDTVWVVFNGEIYNYPELRVELEKLGHKFRTDHSDTEVIVHLYEEYGVNYLHKLNGMFAIALWDLRKQELHLARDRVGIKPLFYTLLNGNIIFASEIKSILNYPSIICEPNFVALNHYFSFKNTPAPLSAFKNINQLCAGERILFKKGRLTKHRWWAPNYSDESDIDEIYAAEKIRELLHDSIRLRMRSDVPFGAYLSGGIDSSSIVALMSSMTNEKIKTFTLVYEDKLSNKHNDRRYANEIAERFNTDHHEYVLSYREIPENINDILFAFDEPFSGVTSTFFLTKLISKYVKVALSGDGADELFGSYLSHRLAYPLFHYRNMMTNDGNVSQEKRCLLVPYDEDIGRLTELVSRGNEAESRMGLYLWDDKEKEGLFTEKMKAYINGESTYTLVSSIYKKCSSKDPLNRALYLDFETLLPDQVLSFVDRLSMAHSVEVRPPFLDYRLVEFVTSLPGNIKIKNGNVKYILKKALKDVLPDAILRRPKEGFVMPVNFWLKGKLRPYVEDVLSTKRLEKHGLLNTRHIQNIIDEQYSLNIDNGSKIWNLMMFQIWWENYF